MIGNNFQIHLHKVPSRAITETSSGRIKPRFPNNEEVYFIVPPEDRDIFLLHFRPDILPEVEQYEIHLQIKKKFKSKLAGQFGICYNDLQQDQFSKTVKTRNLKSQMKPYIGMKMKGKIKLKTKVKLMLTNHL